MTDQAQEQQDSQATAIAAVLTALAKAREAEVIAFRRAFTERLNEIAAKFEVVDAAS